MNIKKIAIGVALAVSVALACGFNGQGGVLVEETYTVKSGDTLWTIADMYVIKNTHGPRDIREFISGITELNYDAVFINRQPGEIHPGDQLLIHYWIKE